MYNTFNFYSEVEGSDNTFRWFLVVAGFRLGHHHLAELIKVHGAGAVLQTTDNLLFFCWLAEKLSNFVGCYIVDSPTQLAMFHNKYKTEHSRAIC